MRNDFQRLAELIDQRRRFVVACVADTTGSTPRKTGARMIVFPDGSFEGTIGGGAMEEHVKRHAAEMFETGGTRIVTVNLRKGAPCGVGGICGGDVQLFLECIDPSPRLLIFGAGHCGRTLARMAAELDLSLLVHDDRPEYADPAQFPDGCRVVCGPFEDLVTLTDPGPEDLVVVMTYAWPKDKIVVQSLFDRPLSYLGMIGSRYKCRQVIDQLREEGATDEQIDRIHAPIGIDIGAHTPAEVAVSILAQIVAHLNRDEAPPPSTDAPAAAQSVTR